jgi:hypothetical protein
MQHYFNYYGSSRPLGKDMEYIVAEVTFRVPIPGTKNYFRGTIDGIAKHIPTGDIYIVEHKTYAKEPAQLLKLQTDPQIISYVWAAEALLGQPIAGVVYDGIAKRVPAIPNINTDGSLSKAWILTTAETYYAAVKALGLEVDPYVDLLNRLHERDKSDNNAFFRRHKVRYSRASIESQVADLAAISREMASKHLVCYPTFPWTGCFDCNFRDLCEAMQKRGKLDSIIRNRYQPAKGWKTTRTEEPVTDLRWLLKPTIA